MGHIELASPVAHIWFLKSLPSRLGMVLDMTYVILSVYFTSKRCVIEPGMTPLQRGQIMTEEEYNNKVDEYGDEFTALMGAEAIRELLRTLDIDMEAEVLLRRAQNHKLWSQIKENIEAPQSSWGLPEIRHRSEWMILKSYRRYRLTYGHCTARWRPLLWPQIWTTFTVVWLTVTTA